MRCCLSFKNLDKDSFSMQREFKKCLITQWKRNIKLVM